MRIGKKLVLSYTLLAILTFLVTGAILRTSIAYFYTESLTNQLIARANGFKVAVDELGDKDLKSTQTANLLKKLANATNTRITLIDTKGTVLADTQAANPGMLSNHADRPEVKQALAGHVGKAKRFSATSKQNLLYVAVPYQEDGKTTGIIRIALPMADTDEAVAEFTLIMFLIALGATILVVATSNTLATSLTRPMNQMMAMADKIAKDDLDQMLPIDRQDEIGELSRSLQSLVKKSKERIDELRSEKAKAELILDNMNEGLLLLNKDGEVVLTNPSVERIFSLKASSVVGRPILDALENHDLINAIQESMHSNKEVHEEFELADPFKKLRVRVLPIKNSLGEEQSLAVIRDITREKYIERVRKDFIANVSHELKTPLTGLKLLSETLLRTIDTDPAASKRFVERLDKELDTHIKMVLELIDLSRIESSNYSTERLPVNINRLVEEVGSSFSEIAANKGVRIEFKLADDVPPIMAHKDQVLTLIRNLIDNAIRYTLRGGEIEVGVARGGDSVNFVVKDTGIGLAKREVPRIFERFYRVDKARSRDTGGTGLGLSIVKHIAENHGATIDVKSLLGVGSTFTVSFPVNPPEITG